MTITTQKCSCEVKQRHLYLLSGKRSCLINIMTKLNARSFCPLVILRQIWPHLLIFGILLTI